MKQTSMSAPVITVESSSTKLLRQIRPLALFIGFLFAIPAAAFPAHAFLFILSGTVVGLTICFYLQLRAEQKSDRMEANDIFLIDLPEGYEGLGSFKDRVFLELRQTQQLGQLELPSLPSSQSKRTRKGAVVVSHPPDKDAYLIDCDRFVALLLDRMTEDANKAAEHAVLMGIQRYRNMGQISKELERVLNDPAVIEVIKSDFRGNMLMVINRTGEKVIRELIRRTKEARDPKRASSTQTGAVETGRAKSPDSL